MKLFAKAENLCAIGLIIFFFFPWVNLGGFIKVAGYEIPDVIKGLGQFATIGSKTKEVDPFVYLFYIIYLMPIFSVFTIIFSVADKNVKLIGFNAGIVPIFASLYVIGLGGAAVFKFMAVGAYLTLLTAIAMILSVFEVIRLPIQLEQIQTLNKTAHSSIDAPTETVSSSVHRSFAIVFSVLVSLVISHFSLNIRSVMAELDISYILLVWSQIIVLLIGFSSLVGYFIKLDQYARPFLVFGGTLVTIDFFIMSIASFFAYIILGGILISIGLLLKLTCVNFKIYRQIEILIGMVFGMILSFLLYIVLTGSFGWRLSMIVVTILVITLTEVEFFLYRKSSETTSIKETNLFLHALLMPVMLYCV